MRSTCCCRCSSSPSCSSAVWDRCTASILGALFVRLLPQFIAIIRDDLPFGIGRMPGLEPSLFGLVLVIVILFEPGGIYGRWIKMKHWFQAYPLKRRTSFRRQKSYARSERLR